MRAGLLVVAFLVACNPKPPQAPPAPTPAAAPPAEPSVRPGANKQFLASDLDPGSWKQRFETEGREIYDRRRELAASARVKPGGAVADVGAGSGLFTMLFAEIVGPRGRVYAVDIAPKFLALIDKRARDANLPQVKTVLGTERSVELPPASVDVVFLCDTYHHFEYPRSSLASIHRALRPGGELLLIDFHRVPGQSAPWVLDHVRAGQDVFTAEIRAAGFELVEELPLLKENYVLRFRRR